MANNISGTGSNDTLNGDTNGADLNDFIDGKGGDDSCFGGSGADTLRGGAGNDSLNGGSGNDSLDGNVGNDTLRGGGGTDLVNGGDGDDVLLIGAEGGVITRFDGGAGFDVIDGSAASGPLAVQSSIGVEKVIMSAFGDAWGGGSGAERFEGRGGNDSISGAAGDDTILGGDGDDQIGAGEGNDSVDGGAGFDWYFMLAATAGVDASLLRGKASGMGAKDVFANMEGLGGSAFADKLTGDDADNGFIGIEGADTIDGRGGLDFVFYSSFSVGQTIDLLNGVTSGSMGADTLVSIEDVIGSQGDDVVVGSAVANRMGGQGGADTISGEGGADSLNGGVGADSLDGGVGVDTLFGGADNDVLKGGAHDDQLSGDIGNDSLDGGSGADSLAGGDGADTLNGGFGGGDTLSGGAGADKFAWRDADMWNDWTEAVIVDFSAAGGDVIDLSDIDANSKKDGNQAFQVVAAFTKPGQMVMTYDSGSNTTHVQCQIDKDADLDFTFVVNGDVTGGTGFML